ncbi:carbohydrate kinase [Solibacillus sp. FSL R7-0682]|uniref:carbohydrate kinase family protein n=1 Tax=Solibacillus sp. FSL R7-0682 TaxID=2921690 RepID=UPI0030FB65C4
MLLKKVLCIGELLIDFYTTEIQQSIIQSNYFEKQAGGAPANVSAAIAKLGGIAYFCGKVGADAFGHFLKQTILAAGVHTDHLIFDANAPTTLAFVSRQPDGERDFIFNRGADERLSIEDLNLQQLFTMDIIHFGSATALLSNPFCKTYEQLLQTYRIQNRFISFDPNYRSNLWKGNVEEFTHKCKPFLQAAHFIKMSEEELFLFAQTSFLEDAIEWLQQFDDKIFAITRGANGTIFVKDGHVTHIATPSIRSIDATGAGDAFVGAVLYQLSLLDEASDISFDEWKNIIQFANQVGAKVCEKVGAIEALPTLDEVCSAF